MFQKTVTRKNLLIATILAYSLVPLAGLATDIYLPSMPGMAVSLHEPASHIQLTLTFFLVTYGAAQIMSGSILDAFGRYRITMISLLIFAASCLVTAYSRNLTVILLMRVIQGVTSGFIVVSKRAFFVDLYEGAQLHRLLSSMTIVWSTAPILAPFVGGYLQETFGWQSNFLVLAGYALLLFVLEGFFSGESLRQRHPLRLDSLMTAYGEMLRAPDFVIAIALLGFSYGTAMMFSMTGPFIIEHVMHYSAVIAGYASLSIGAAIMVGGIISRSLIRLDPRVKSRYALALQTLIAVAMIFLGRHQSLHSMMAVAFLFHVNASFIFNIFFALSLSRFPQYAGMANGLVGGGLFFLVSIFSYLAVALLHPTNQTRLGLGYLCFSLASIVSLILWNIMHKRES